MSIKPIDMNTNGIIQRADDIGMVKNQQDAKPIIDQQHLLVQQEEKEDKLAHQVIDPENTTKPDTHADAREESKNSYFQRKKKKNINKKDGKPVPTDKVIKKKAGGSFNMTI